MSTPVNNLPEYSLPIDPSTGKPITADQLREYQRILRSSSASTKESKLAKEYIFGAVREGHRDSMLFLLQSKVDPKVLDKEGISVLNYAISNRHRDVIDLILSTYPKKQAVDVNSPHPLDQLVCVMGTRANPVKTPPIVLAALYNDIITVRKLVDEHGVKINNKNAEGRTALHIAASENSAEIVDFLLELKADINACDKNQSTPVMIAASYGNFDIVKKLVEKKANLELKDIDKLTVHYHAVKTDNVEMLEFLLKICPIDIDENNNKQQSTLLHRAALQNSAKVVSFLLKRGADPNLEMTKDHTALTIAISLGYYKVLYTLLYQKPTITNSLKETSNSNNGNNGNNSNALDKPNNSTAVTTTAVTSAAAPSNAVTATVVPSNQAPANKTININRRSSKKGFTPLLVAITAMDDRTQSNTVDSKTDTKGVKTKEHYLTIERMINLLIDAGADIHLANNRQQNPLDLAAHIGKVAILKNIIDKSNSIKKPFTAEELGFALCRAIVKNHFDCVKLLLDSGANVNVLCRILNVTPLIAGFTCLSLFRVEEAGTKVGKNENYANCLKILHLLLSQPFDPNIQNGAGSTALQAAALYCNDLRLIALLCNNPSNKQKTADVTILDKFGNTFLMAAAVNNDIAVLGYFLKNYPKLNLNQRNNKGMTALHLAVKANHFISVGFLLEHEIDYNIKDFNNVTALMIAAENGNLIILNLLLDQGDPDDEEQDIDIDAQNKDGFTALHLAAENGHFECVKALLANGSDPNIIPQDGWTVLMRIISSNAKVDLVELLIESGADVNVVSKDQCSAISLAESGDIVQCLKEAGATGKPINYYKRFIAALWDNKEAEINLMLKEGIDINDDYKNHPLFLYSYDCKLNIKAQLLKYKLQMDAKDILKNSDGKEANETNDSKSNTELESASLNTFKKILQSICQDIILNSDGRVTLIFNLDDKLKKSGRINQISLSYHELIKCLPEMINWKNAKPNSKATHQLVRDKLFKLYDESVEGKEEKMRLEIAALEEELHNNVANLNHKTQKNSELIKIINANVLASGISIERVQGKQTEVLGINLQNLEEQLTSFIKDNERLLLNEHLKDKLAQASKQCLVLRKKLIEDHKQKIVEAINAQAKMTEHLNQCHLVLQNMQSAGNNSSTLGNAQQSNNKRHKTKLKTIQINLLNHTDNLAHITSNLTSTKTVAIDSKQTVALVSEPKPLNEASEIPATKVSSSHTEIIERKIEEIASSPQVRKETKHSLDTSPDTDALENEIYANEPRKKYRMELSDELSFKLRRLDAASVFKRVFQQAANVEVNIEDLKINYLALEAALIHVLESCRKLELNRFIPARTALLRNQATINKHFTIYERIQFMMEICLNWEKEISIQKVNDNENICLEAVDSGNFLSALAHDNFKPPKFKLNDQLKVISDAEEELRYCEQYVIKQGKIAAEDEQIKFAIGRCRCKIGTAMSDIRKAALIDNNKIPTASKKFQQFFDHLNKHEIAAAKRKFNELNPIQGKEISFAGNFRHNDDQWKPEVESTIREWLNRAQAKNRVLLESNSESNSRLNLLLTGSNSLVKVTDKDEAHQKLKASMVV